MKKVKLISLALSMLLCFIAKAQEKATSKEHAEPVPIATTQSLKKSKDTLTPIKVSPNFVQPTTFSRRITICAPSRSALNEPLYILDGTRIDSKQFSKVNPNDIESVKVLKGTEATSLFGNQGRNGVIIIITKEED